MRFYGNGTVRPAPDASGGLLVTVTTAAGALPLFCAAVSVSRDCKLLSHYITGCDGSVPEITVQISTEAPKKPYTEVTVRVYLAGYNAVERSNIQVFQNCTSYLQIDLAPSAGTYREEHLSTPPHLLFAEAGGA